MLKGKDLNLRELRISDLERINEWRNNLYNKIMTQSYRLPVTYMQDEEWLKRKVLSTTNAEVFFIIEENNIPIGMVQLTNIDYTSGTAIWGIIIGEIDNRGKGYGAEAELLLFNYAFNVLNLRKLICYIVSLNNESLKMHKKLKFLREEGCLKKHYYFNNCYWDVYIFAYYREDFADLKIAL